MNRDEELAILPRGSGDTLETGDYCERLLRHRDHELSVVGLVRGREGADEHALTLHCDDCGKTLLVAPRP